MEPFILIPKEKAKKEVRDGRNFGFWHEFWKTFTNKEKYQRRLTKVSKNVDEVLSSKNDTDLIYAKVKLVKKSKSKSTKPWLIWEDSGLDIVSSKDNLTYVVSGKKREFERIKNIYTRSSFDTAKNGGQGITIKEKNMQRELFSVSSIEDISSSWIERVDNKIKSLIESNSFDQVIDCVIEISPNIKDINNYEIISKKLVERFSEEKITQVPYELFVYNMLYRANLSIKEIYDLLNDKNYSEIKLVKVITVFGAQRCIPNLGLSNIKIGKPETGIIVGVIDSGVETNTIFNQLRFNYEKYIPSNKQPNKTHGTFVASRVLFGENIFNSAKSGYLSPCAKFLDVHVLYDDPEREACADEIILSQAILEVTKKYPNVEIYNLSTNSDDGVGSNFPINESTILLDKIAQEQDILFVVSSGNNHWFHSEPYQTLFSNPSINTKIAPPGDALNVISVGAVSKNANQNCFCCTPNYPAPFTRKGGIRGGWKKPELVIDGGNILKPSDSNSISEASHLIASENQMGVEGITVNGLSKKPGTSFSAPLISRMCVYLLDYLKRTNIDQLVVLNKNKVNLVKALLIHSASKAGCPIEDQNLQLAYGFGIPDIENITKDDPNEVTILYSDVLYHTQKKHKLHFELPESLVGKQLEFHLTLTYNPPVNNNYKNEYAMNSVKATMRFLVPVFDEETKQYTTKYLPNNPKWDWTNYYKKTFNSIDFKKVRNKIPSRVLEMLVQLDSSPFYEKDMAGSVDQINQPYSFILTIKDLSSQNVLREELLLSNKYDKLQISQQAQVQVS